jgi:hypothetical protein
MGKYTPDDNRSMQLNPNNDRYYSSRDVDIDGLFDHEDQENTITFIKGNIMLLEFSNQIINTQRITEITAKLVDLKLKTKVIKGNGYYDKEDSSMVIVYPTVRITVHTDIANQLHKPHGKSLSMNFTPTEPEEERWETNEGNFRQCLYFSDYLPKYPGLSTRFERVCFKTKLVDEEVIKEEVRKDISKSLNIYARHIIKRMISNQKCQIGE